MHVGVLSIFQNYRDEHDDSEPPRPFAGQLVFCDRDVLFMRKFGSMSQADAESSTTLLANEVLPSFHN